jgi:hypothetical protein
MNLYKKIFFLILLLESALLFLFTPKNFSFCLNALVYNKSLKSKIKEFWSVINDKRIPSNTKIFNIKRHSAIIIKNKWISKNSFFFDFKIFEIVIN